MENEKIDSEYWRSIARPLGDRIAMLTYRFMLNEIVAEGPLAMSKWEDEMRVACGEALAKMQSHLESKHTAWQQGSSGCSHCHCWRVGGMCCRCDTVRCDAVNTTTTDRQRG